MPGGKRGLSTSGCRIVGPKRILAAFTAASWLLAACQASGPQSRPAPTDQPAKPRLATVSPAPASLLTAYPPPLASVLPPPGYPWPPPGYPRPPSATPGPTSTPWPTSPPTPTPIGTLLAQTGCYFDSNPQTLAAEPDQSAPTLVWPEYLPDGLVLRGLRAGHVETVTSPAGIVRFWGYNATTGTIAYSTDGSFIDLSSNLWTYNLGSGATSQVAQGSVYGGQWSPDGRQLALLCNNTLTVLSATRPPAALATGVLWPRIGHLGYRWSPDSTRLAYFAPGQGAVAFALYVVTVETGQIISVETFPSGEDLQHLSQTPFWSPDSQYVFYWDDFHANPLTIARADGSSHWQLPYTTNTPKPRRLDHFLWTPDLRTLVADGGDNCGAGQGVWLFRLSANLKTIADVRLAVPQGGLMGWAIPGQSVVVGGQVLSLDALWQASQPGGVPSPSSCD